MSKCLKGVVWTGPYNKNGIYPLQTNYGKTYTPEKLQQEGLPNLWKGFEEIPNIVLVKFPETYHVQMGDIIEVQYDNSRMTKPIGAKNSYLAVVATAAKKHGNVNNRIQESQKQTKHNMKR